MCTRTRRKTDFYTYRSFWPNSCLSIDGYHLQKEDSYSSYDDFPTFGQRLAKPQTFFSTTAAQQIAGSMERSPESTAMLHILGWVDCRRPQHPHSPAAACVSIDQLKSAISPPLQRGCQIRNTVNTWQRPMWPVPESDKYTYARPISGNQQLLRLRWF